MSAAYERSFQISAKSTPVLVQSDVARADLDSLSLAVRLPNGDRAIVDLRKLRDYCLNPSSPRGRHKARVFLKALGLTRADAPRLQKELLQAAQTGEAVPGIRDEYGQRYGIEFLMVTGSGRERIHSGWIVLSGTTEPRFTTCYVKKGSR